MNNSNLTKDYLTLTQFSKIVGVTIETLRHYERKGLFQPEKIINTRRFYCPTQISTFKMISVFKDIGIPLDAIKEYVTHRSPENIMRLFTKQKSVVTDRIRYYNEAHTVISIYLELITEGMCAIENELTVVEMTDRAIVLGEIVDANESFSIHSIFMKFRETHNDMSLNVSYPIGGYFDTMDDFRSRPEKPMRFFSINPKGEDIREGGLYLVGYTRGYYEHINNLSAQMSEFAEDHGLLFSGPVFNTYLFNEVSINDRDNYLLQVSAAVKEKQGL